MAYEEEPSEEPEWEYTQMHTGINLHKCWDRYPKKEWDLKAKDLGWVCLDMENQKIYPRFMAMSCWENMLLNHWMIPPRRPVRLCG